MPASLPVDLNGARLHQIDAPASFTTTGSFSIDLDNHGQAVHVHLHLDDDLSRVARIDVGNHYVDAQSVRPVEVTVRQVDDPVTGKLKIVTGYGTESEYVAVTVEPAPEPTQQGVQVDERLSRPRKPEPEETVVDRLAGAIDQTTLPVLALGAFAIVLALGVGIAAGSTPVLVAAGAVAVGVVLAIAYLLG